MLENLYTTKMSADKKVLQLRFLKIRSHSGKLSRVLCIALFIILLIVITISSIITAVNTTDNYTMSEKEFADFLKHPIGSIMADLDYVDDEKLVFHYLEGFFIINKQNYEMIHKINLKKLNIAGHTQGDCFTDFKIDKSGNYAYLTNVGEQQLVKKYDNYIINLESGEVKIGNAPYGTDFFENYADTLSSVNDIYGWCSNKCIIDGDSRTYYLTVQENTVAAIQLVTIHHKADELTGMGYVFGKNYISAAQQKDNIIKKSLAKGEEISTQGSLKWEVNANIVRSVIHKISELRQTQYKEIKDGNYLVAIHYIENNGETYQKLFIVDNYTMELVLSEKIIDEDYYMGIINILNSPTSELYHKTVEFLEQEFHRVYDSYYDIQNLIISNWNENGDEATFFYKMTFLYYNRDPDKAEYIQEAKKRSQKEYEVLYNDYLALKEANHEFKVVLNGDKLELFSNIAPKGTEWSPIRIDDYVISE